MNFKSFKPTFSQPKKQKRRIDTLDLFFFFGNFPDEKEIHNIFKYN